MTAMSTFCPKCGEEAVELANGAVYCIDCGTMVKEDEDDEDA